MLLRAFFVLTALAVPALGFADDDSWKFRRESSEQIMARSHVVGYDRDGSPIVGAKHDVTDGYRRDGSLRIRSASSTHRRVGGALPLRRAR